MRGGSNKIKYKEGDNVGNCIFIKDIPSLPKKRRAIFKCVCGIEFESAISDIRRLSTKSCGCLRNKLISQANTKHGMESSPEYSSWHGMKNRCYNINDEHYSDYGGRGIIVCDEWRNNFEQFYKDMGRKPSKQHSLDRIEVNGNYELSNCRWATIKQQANNRRNNIRIEYDGEIKTIAEWANVLDIDYKKLISRFTSRKERNFAKVVDELLPTFNISQYLVF